MAKKISKHSRAARRGEIDVSVGSSGVKELEDIPRLHKTDTISPMIRASANKNQQLLNQKLHKNTKSKSGRLGKNENTIGSKLKTKRGMILNDKLSSKIEASIARANMIKFTRKANWDQTNKLTKMELIKSQIKNKIMVAKQRKASQEPKLDYETMNDSDDDELLEEKEDPDVPTLVTKQNTFELLGEDVES